MLSFPCQEPFCPLPKNKQGGFRNKILLLHCQDQTSVPNTILSHTSLWEAYWTGRNRINGKTWIDQTVSGRIDTALIVGELLQRHSTASDAWSDSYVCARGSLWCIRGRLWRKTTYSFCFMACSWGVCLKATPGKPQCVAKMQTHGVPEARNRLISVCKSTPNEENRYPTISTSESQDALHLKYSSHKKS